MKNSSVLPTFQNVSSNFQSISTTKIVSPCRSCGDFATKSCKRLATGSCLKVTVSQHTILATYKNSYSPLPLLFNCDQEFYVEAI